MAKNYRCLSASALTACLAVLAGSGDAGAQVAPVKPELKLDVLQVQCRSEARRRERDRNPEALKQIDAIIRVAEEEFARFDGHVIDYSGRIIKFGSVETETASSSTDGKPGKLADVPWRKVARYWEIVRQYRASPDPVPPVLPSIKTDAHPALSVTWIENALSAALDSDRVSNPILLRLLLSAIDQFSGEKQKGDVTFQRWEDMDEDDRARVMPVLSEISPEATKKRIYRIDVAKLQEILREAVVRSAVSDVAWSAAFVSSVMQQAGVPRLGFLQHAQHQRYIRQALLNARRMAAGERADAIYRACDIYSTAVRKGDLVCYHRQAEYFDRQKKAHEGRRLFAQVANDFQANGDALPFGKTHCDIVVDVERDTRRIWSIGGNVYQAVTRRQLTVDRAGVLEPKQGADCQTMAKRSGPQAQSLVGSGPLANQRCNLNRQWWFTLLQHVDPAAKP